MLGAADITSNMKMKARWREAVRKLQLTDWGECGGGDSISCSRTVVVVIIVILVAVVV